MAYYVLCNYLNVLLLDLVILMLKVNMNSATLNCLCKETPLFILYKESIEATTVFTYFDKLIYPGTHMV